jgi:alkanesulfonate monooxygenase SsuD/methylene tetrahydromethanopterin reductase-like flavin-dependent oxidoreductase (luciferase family)
MLAPTLTLYTIQVGSAGVLVDVNLPYRVAQDYTLLANLFPNRIDLGFARGSVIGEKGNELRNDIRPANFYERILKIKKFIENKNDHLSVTPPNGFMPQMWMLGTSNSSIEFAIEHKMNFSLSLFHIIDGELPSPLIINDFEKKFLKVNGYQPLVNIVISVFCSTDEERVLNERKTRKNVRLNVSGYPKQCLSEIKRIKKRYCVDEVIILNLGGNPIERNLLMKTLRIITCLTYKFN